MNNDGNSSDDALQPVLPKRKRRRKRKSTTQRVGSSSYNNLNITDDDIGWRHHTTTAVTSSSTCNALDAELEHRVNELIDQNSNGADNEVNYTKLSNDMSNSLPTLLLIREVGLSSYLGRHRKRIPFIKNVDSLDSNGNNASWKTLLLHRPAHYRKKNGESNHRGDSRSISDSNLESNDNNNPIGTARQLRDPVQDTSACNNENGPYNYKDPYIRSELGTISRRKAWRPYTLQTIQFSKLQTPHSVAILAADQWGGYSIGVEGKCNYHDGSGEQEVVTSLVIKFYGIPSPARLLKCDESPRVPLPITSPLLHTVPLLLESRNNSSSFDESSVQITDTPIQILLCSNGAFGVGYVLDMRTFAALRPNVFSNKTLLPFDVMGKLVIFETPKNGIGRNTKSFHCCNVRMGCWKSFTIRNSIWPTMYVPVKLKGDVSNDDPSSPVFVTNVASAYMLFNDEDDGFRITWIDPFKQNEIDYTSVAESISLQSHNIQAARDDIVTISNVHETWEECISNPITGSIHQSNNNKTSSPPTNDHATPQLHIVHEVYLHIDALLIDILTRRQRSSSMFQKSPYQSDTVRFIPNFYYNLISVSEEGLDVTLVIVFSNKEKMIMQASSSQSALNKKKVPAALGVVINFNLFNCSYDELKWVQHPNCGDDSSMKLWCNSLALNWRMKECGVGVFCLDEGVIGKKNDTWVGPTHEQNVNDDLEDDSNVALWTKYHQSGELARAVKGKQPKPPKDISMSSLYPHCDVITNSAVYNAVPVKKISSRKSPVEFIYG